MAGNAGIKIITDEAQAETRPMSEPERVLDIGSHQVGPLRYLPMNYRTGDAASQNMTEKATVAACRKRVVAEARINYNVLKRLIGVE